jgi:hypothetical protein
MDLVDLWTPDCLPAEPGIVEPGFHSRGLLLSAVPAYEANIWAPRVDTSACRKNLLHPLQENIGWERLGQVELPGSVKLDNPVGASGHHESFHA